MGAYLLTAELRVGARDELARVEVRLPTNLGPSKECTFQARAIRE
jgi:hypothetical protein